MDGRQAGKITPDMFVLALVILGGSCAAFVFPFLSSSMVYDRQAILSGELWRLYTGHLVHFSRSHLLYNLFGFMLAAWVAQQRGYAGVGFLCVLSATVVSGAILLLQPEMIVYGGLSGIANGLMVFIACHGLTEKGRWRLLSLTVLLLCIGNTLAEALSGRPTLAASGEIRFVPAFLAHVAGGLTGAVMAWGVRVTGKIGFLGREVIKKEIATVKSIT